MTTEFKSWEEMSELEQLESTYCDLHKDVYGVKARWYHADTVEQAREDLASLQRQAEEVWAAEAVREAKAAEEVESRIDRLIAMGAGTRADALRWLHDARGTQGDDDYLAYQLGLKYGYFKKAA